jgi:hypothetical protein
VYEGLHLAPLKLGPTGGALGTDHGIRSKQRIDRADAEQIAHDVGSELSGADIRLSFVGELAGRWAAMNRARPRDRIGLRREQPGAPFPGASSVLTAVERAGAYGAGAYALAE